MSHVVDSILKGLQDFHYFRNSLHFCGDQLKNHTEIFHQLRFWSSATSVISTSDLISIKTPLGPLLDYFLHNMLGH